MESERIESTALLHGRFFSGEDLLGLGPDDWEVAAMFGLIALTYGLLALGFPGITVVIVTYLCASFAVVSGSKSIFGGFRGMGNSDDRSASWFAVIEGLLWLLCGLCGLILPGMTAVLMLYIIAAWAVLTGYNEVVIGFLSGMDIHWINFFNGCGLIILGSYLYAESPTEGILTLLWAVGVQGTIGGTFLLVTSFRLRREQLTRNTQQEEEHPST